MIFGATQAKNILLFFFNPACFIFNHTCKNGNVTKQQAWKSILVLPQTCIKAPFYILWKNIFELVQVFL